MDKKIKCVADNRVLNIQTFMTRHILANIAALRRAHGNMDCTFIVDRSSLIVTLVAPIDRQEVNCNSSKDASCQLSIPPQSKKKIQGLKERSVAKKSLSDIKTRIRKVKPCTA